MHCAGPYGCTAPVLQTAVGALIDIIRENERSVTGSASLRDIFHEANEAPAFLSLLLAKEMNSNLSLLSFNGTQHLWLLPWFTQLYLA